MTLVQAGLLFAAAVLGGALNSVAGGGSFITFPALIFTGVLPVNANATSTVALWPGTIASVAAYRAQFGAQRGVILLLGGASTIGGILGAILLLRTPQATFGQLIPWLLLLATVLFTFGGAATARLRARLGKRSGRSWPVLAGIVLVQLAVAIYGGYFGGGIGFIILAALALMGMSDIHQMNALRALLASCINGVAVLTFVVAGAVAWPEAIVMVAGAIAGGYGGAHYARRLDPQLVRRFVIAVGCGMTLYFFLRR